MHIPNLKVGKYSPPIFNERKALGSSLIVTPWIYFPGSSLILNPCEWNFRKKHLKFGTKSYIIDKPLKVSEIKQTHFFSFSAYFLRANTLSEKTITLSLRLKRRNRTYNN